ncbi:MAG: DUF2270 domain-containing protein [Acidobacteriota bacterium]|nr:DUF2270 domain-containing protein [Acidobacteriota bacterium]
MTDSEFNTAMAHFYRGEVSRSNTWRSRLDATTNWAVVTTGAALTFVFGTVDHSPAVILILTWLVLLFLFIEARRYRYYELWSYRVRLLETNHFAPQLSAGSLERPGWAERLVESLHHPRFPITLLEAVGRRYRRNYAPLFLVLAVAWIVKLAIHPSAVTGWQAFLGRAAIGPIHGGFVVAAGVVFNALLIALGVLTVGLRESEGEVFGAAPKGFRRLGARLAAATREALEVDLAARAPWPAGRKHLAFVISDKIQEIGGPLLAELDRGVTLLKGTGMFSGREHGIMMCVVRGRQVTRLKEIVYRNDPKAFVVVTGVQDVRGEGFRPLEA